MRKIITGTLLFTCLFIFQSCKKSSDASTTCTNNTGWIANGHKFVYENFSFFLPADTLFISINDLGSNVFSSTTVFDDGTTIPSSTGFLQPCGNSIFQASTSTLADKQEIYRIDGNVGDSWQSVATSSQGYTVTTTSTITAKDVSVTVAAGTFTCLKIHMTSVSSNPGSSAADTDFYINNEAGIIKVSGNTVHYELVRKNY